MDGEEKPELEEEVESQPPSEGMEPIPRGCMLAIWWLTLIVVLGFILEFVLGKLGIIK